MNSWLFYALLVAVSASFVTIFSKIGINNPSPSMATSIRSVITDLFFLVFAGVPGALSWLFLNIALKSGKTWQVASIDKLSVVITVTASILIFKETISIKGIIGVIFIAIGTVFVALG